jgi:hypothetical protein
MNPTLIRALCLGAFALAAGACSSMNSQQGTLQAVQDSVSGAPGSGAAAQPYVEAFVEVSGPHARWSGPATLSVHVVAREPGQAKITLTPELFASSPAPTVRKQPDARAPASVQTIPSDTARQQLAQLATSLLGGDEPFSGCVMPVRVRLVRQDGAVLDKQGCRSQTGWTRAAGELAATWIASGPAR